VSTPGMNRLESGNLETGLHTEMERLARRNAYLEDSNEDLEWSLFVASHDLHEPLRTITLYAQLLEKKCGRLLDDESGLFVGNIIEGATRMRQLLEDLLTYTELGARHPGSVGGVDLNWVLEIVVQNLKLSIDETQAVITCDRLPIVAAHASDLIPLFQNLIANAIKYRSGRPPRIGIGVQHGGGQVRFAVSDNGIGIDPEHHVEIFDPFKRLHGKNIPGTGIGLAICRRVVERYGGRIWVESRVGEGATFLFTLPDAMTPSPGEIDE
jgi:light-regulated signal transduction histidine kinase (bacteriophytochrome)